MTSIVVGPGLGAAKKVLLSLSVLGAAGSIAALGTFAQFTSSTSAAQEASTGTMTVALGASGTAANRLTVAAADMAPGDTVQRSVDLVNSGTIGLSDVTLTTAASPSSILDTNTVHGLQVAIDRCSVAWTESASAPYAYSCSGTAVAGLAIAVAAAVPALAEFGRGTSASQQVSTGTLAAPTQLAAAHGVCVQAKSTSVELSWTPTASQFATGYSIWRSSGPGMPFDMIGTAGGRTATGYTDTTVNFGTLYFYEVRSLRNNWSSAPTAAVSLLTRAKSCR